MAYTFQYGDRPLDGITIQRAVGRGGFGEVYYALTDSGKQVALKYLRDNADVELRGVQNVLNLKSPHLIAIHDVRKDARGDSWIVMEYLSGPSLRDLLIAEPNGLGYQKSAFILQGIAKGLAYLHDRGIVHRDLKPGNIFYDDGYVKIGDYGLSKYIPVSRHSNQTMSVGTVHYMAPEIGSGKYSKAIDVYALGVILYEMLTGRLPYAGSSMGEVLMRHLSDKPDLSGLPEPFASVIAKALAKTPEERYQDATEMSDAIALSAEFAASAATFDHSVLSRVQPRVEAQPAVGGGDPARTMTTPPRRPIPSLDVRDVRWPEQFDSGQNDRLQRLMRKFEKRVSVWQKKFEKHGVRTNPPPTAAARDESLPMPHTNSWRVTRAFILAAVAVAVSIGLALIADVRGDTPKTIVSLSMFTVLGVLGGLFAHLWCMPRFAVHAQNWMFQRVLYASVGALFMSPALAPASAAHGNLAGLILGPIAAMLILDWRRLADRGRRGGTDGWTMFWAAIIGMAATGKAGVRIDNAPLVGGGMCATIVLLTQIAAGMWPLARTPRRGEQPATPDRDRHDDDADNDGGASANVAGAYAPTMTGYQAQSPRGTFSMRIDAAPAAAPAPVADMGPGGGSSAEPEPFVVAPKTRFFGKSRAALGSFAAALCVLALLGAIGMNLPAPSQMHPEGYGRILRPLRVAQNFPPHTFLLMSIGGGALLVASRVGEGWRRVFMGFGAALLTFFACGMATSSVGARRLSFFLANADYDTIFARGLITPDIALFGAALLCALGALFWPAPRPRPRASATAARRSAA